MYELTAVCRASVLYILGIFAGVIAELEGRSYTAKAHPVFYEIKSQLIYINDGVIGQ